MRIYSEDIIWGWMVFVIIGAIAWGIYIGSKNNTTKVIDGCVYIQTWNGHGFNLTHKGNCTNSIHYKK